MLAYQAQNTNSLTTVMNMSRPRLLSIKFSTMRFTHRIELTLTLREKAI